MLRYRAETDIGTILDVLRAVDQGMLSLKDTCAKYEISQQTYYNWRRKHWDEYLAHKFEKGKTETQIERVISDDNKMRKAAETYASETLYRVLRIINKMCDVEEQRIEEEKSISGTDKEKTVRHVISMPLATKFFLAAAPYIIRLQDPSGMVTDRGNHTFITNILNQQNITRNGNNKNTGKRNTPQLVPGRV